MNNYQFDDFVLISGQVLYRNGALVSIPPKELAMLSLLVESAGMVITKEKIISEVWSGGDVSDESLTRCIYVLRRILGDNPSCRFIETVYGKGYRFIMPVSFSEEITPSQLLNEDKIIAIYPFVMKDRDEAHAIFDYIINHDELFQSSGIRFMPSALTATYSDFNQSFQSVRKSGADYFLTGMEVVTGQDNMVRLELIQSDSMMVVAREGIIKTSDSTLNLISFSNAIISLINTASNDEKLYASAVKEIKNNQSVNHQPEYNSAIFQIEKIYADIKTKIDAKNYEGDALCNLAACYLSLAFLGVIDFATAENIITIITKKVLDLEPQNAQALSMQALITPKQQIIKKNESDFHLAMILSPLSPHVYYYYACFLTKEGNFSKALQLVRMALSLKESFFAAQVLEMTILFLSEDTIEAIDKAKARLGYDQSMDIILHSLLSLFYKRNRNQYEKLALSHLGEVKMWRDSCTFVSCVYNFVMRGEEAQNLLLDKLENITSSDSDYKSSLWVPYMSAGT